MKFSSLESVFQNRKEGELPIIVSLPRNDLSLAHAAIQAGASGIKIHLNAEHRASGTRFGSFSEEREFLKEVSELKIPKAVMIGQETTVSDSEALTLRSIGFEAFNLYLHHARPHHFLSGMRPLLALGHSFTDGDIQKIVEDKNAWIEASVVDPKEYGRPLNETDLENYRRIVHRSGKVVLVPSQKKLQPSDLSKIAETGVSGLILGVIVTGKTHDTIYNTVREFVQAQER